MRIVLWAVTLLRVALIPVFVLTAGAAQEAGRTGGLTTTLQLATLATMVAIGVSDILDGWIARRFDLITDQGSMADSVADKLAQVALVTYFALDVGPVFTALPMWFLIVVFGRDLVLIVGVSVLRLRYGPLSVEHRIHGRVTSVLFILVLLWCAVGLTPRGLTPLLGLTAALSLYSGTLYALDGAAQGRRRTAEIG